MKVTISLKKKKDNERFYLDKFLALLSKVADEIHHEESPDFIVSIATKKIGIEVTDFHSDLKGESGRPRRAVEETWTLLQGMIMEEVDKYNKLKETFGLLSFKKLELPPKSKHKKFTDELIKLSLEIIDSDYKVIKPGGKYPLLNKYLEKFCLERVGCYITWQWNHNVSSIGITETRLINAIKSKIEKVVKYKEKNIDDLWLLIVSGHMLSQAMGLNLHYKLNTFDQLNNLLKHSGFNKIFIYQYMFDVIYKWPGWVKIGKENFIKFGR